MSDSHDSIWFLTLWVVCVPPIASGSVTMIFETVISLSFIISCFFTFFISNTSCLSEIKSRSSGESFEKQYGL